LVCVTTLYNNPGKRGDLCRILGLLNTRFGTRFSGILGGERLYVGNFGFLGGRGKEEEQDVFCIRTETSGMKGDEKKK